MPIIEIEVRNKVARQTNDETYTCDNSDYTAVFDLDAEWTAYPLKTARFEWNEKFIDVVFEGNTCPAPKVHNTSCVKIGVYAGNLRTTTPVEVLAKKSILSGDIPAHDEPPADVYNQLMEQINADGMFFDSVRTESAKNAEDAANSAKEAAKAADEVESALSSASSIVYECHLEDGSGNGSWDPWEETFFFDLPAPLVDGEKYTVTLNGNKHTATAKAQEDDDYAWVEVSVEGAFYLRYNKDGLLGYPYNAGLYYKDAWGEEDSDGLYTWIPTDFGISYRVFNIADTKNVLPKVDLVATFADGTIQLYKLYGEAVAE